MRLVFYIFLFSQVLNLVGVFAEQIKIGSPDSKQIKWEKVKENKTKKTLKKIIWKSYQDDESYFLDENDDESFKIKKLKNFRGVYTYKSRQKSHYSITEIEPFLPLNNFLDYGDFQSSVRWK